MILPGQGLDFIFFWRISLNQREYLVVIFWGVGGGERFSCMYGNYILFSCSSFGLLSFWI